MAYQYYNIWYGIRQLSIGDNGYATASTYSKYGVPIGVKQLVDQFLVDEVTDWHATARCLLTLLAIVRLGDGVLNDKK